MYEPLLAPTGIAVLLDFVLDRYRRISQFNVMEFFAQFFRAYSTLSSSRMTSSVGVAFIGQCTATRRVYLGLEPLLWTLGTVAFSLFGTTPRPSWRPDKVLLWIA